MKTMTRISAALMLGLGMATASAGTLDINVDGVLSVDPEGDVLNTIIIIELEAPATITGLGWDVTLFADSPSFLSEMVVSFGPVGGPAELYLTPGFAETFPGTMSYSSGGILDLTDNGIDDILLADGMLQIEFFEDFDDYVDDWDGIWEGTLTIECEGECQAAGPTPTSEPGILMLFGFGLIGVYLARRRVR